MRTTLRGPKLARTLGALLMMGATASTLAHAQEDALDPTFGIAGIVRTDLDGPGGATDILVQPDGKIVVSGGTDSGATLIRYRPDGSLDPSFGTGGIAPAVMPKGEDILVSAIGLQSDGKIVAGGMFGGEWALVRFTDVGDFDTMFGVDGLATFGWTPGLGNDWISDLVVLPDDRIAACGKVVVWGGSGAVDVFGVAQFLANGILDASFGEGGSITTAFADLYPNVFYSHYAAEIVRHPDGEILPDGRLTVVGTFTTYSFFVGQPSSEHFAVARYLSNGSPDPTFGSAGRVIHTPDGVHSFGSSVTLQPDGRAVVVGGPEILLTRLEDDGSLDSSFGQDGWVQVETESLNAAEVVLQCDGKIVVAGNVYPGVAQGFRLFRFTPTGDLDASFGNGGAVATFVPPLDQTYTTGLTLQEDGKLLISGVSDLPNPPNAEFVTARYSMGDACSPTDVAPGRDPDRVGGILAADRSDGRAYVRLSLDRPADVRLRVHDVAGRRVATLADGPRSSGTHQFEFPPVVASGIYFVRGVFRQDAITRSQTIRMVVVR